MRRLVVMGLLTLAGAAGAPAVAHAGIAGEPTTVASALAFPWDVVVLPDGRTLVVERPGRIRVVEGPGTGQILLDEAGTGLDVDKFLGLVAHPAYATNRLLYLYVNYNAGGLRNRIVRLYDDGARLVVQRTIFDGIGSDGNHDGGRMAFGPDGHLYATTGDVHQPDRPQNLQSLNGKILRLLAPGTDADGGVPADNPFVSEGGNARFVWSYGHRHPQGLAFDAVGRLYESEHGPSGETYGSAYPGGNGRCCRDEVNLIERGANYGWPLISGDESRPGLRAPLATSGAGSTWAPGGLAVGPDGHLYMPGLFGQHLREFTLSCDGLSVLAQTEHYRDRFGRLRAATASGNALYFTQDGGSASLLRVPLDPANACPVSAPPPSAVAGLPPASPPPPAAAPAATSRAALRRLLDRAARSLQARGLRRLLRAGGHRVRAGGFPPGRLILRLARRRGRPRTLAVGAADVRAGGAVSVRLRVTRTARRALRARTRVRLRLTLVHVAAGDARTTARRAVVLRR